MTTEQEKQFILGLPTDVKLDILESALKENKFGIFMSLSRVLLDAPISEGGVSTELIEEVRKKYF